MSVVQRFYYFLSSFSLSHVGSPSSLSFYPFIAVVRFPEEEGVLPFTYILDLLFYCLLFCAVLFSYFRGFWRVRLEIACRMDSSRYLHSFQCGWWLHVSVTGMFLDISVVFGVHF